MKTLSNLFVLGMLALPIAGFSQITIQNYDFNLPVTPDTAQLQIVGAGNSSITPGTNTNWDLSNLFPGANYDYSFNVVTSANFPNADGQMERPANLGSGVVLDQFYDFYSHDANQYAQVGFEIVGKDFSLGNVTGDMNDTLTTLDTAIHYNQTLIQFPLNYGDTWTNDFTVWIPMRITIESFSFYDELMSLRQDVTTQDSVVGWGTLLLPTGAQADVLLVHSSIVRVDSAFWNNQPMDPVFAQNFGFTQNDTIRADRWSFYAKGLNTAYYEYSVVDGVQSQPYYYRNNDISTGENVALNPIFVYPNPAQDRINIQGAEGERVEVLDLMGRVVLEQESNAQTSTIDISTLSPGAYLVRVGNQTVRIAVN